MRSIAALLAASSLALMGASCEERPTPPVAVEIRVPVPIPCQVPDPQCESPAYDQARKEQPGDVKVRLLRAETATQQDCLRQYRAAMMACRAPAKTAP